MRTIALARCHETGIRTPGSRGTAERSQRGNISGSPAGGCLNLWYAREPLKNGLMPQPELASPEIA
ncbi:hypothetical protein SSBR45G_55170 [Bradyrhizobium sp. SSBR45G]|nr:hypothetical protein SSBR45G_55170 [Bradyrhizobium sp. SSBR45G]GLH85814.1 hypothetical protein SSBR45R_32740 [Bradyrhizobium sp. SSBR45R]